MTDERYTNLDLETAEQLVIAAGKPELAPALYAHAQGVRNLVQGEWGQSFVRSLDEIVGKHIDPIQALLEVSAEQMGKLVADVGDLTVRLIALETRMDESQADRQTIHDEVAALRTELRAYIASNKRDEFARRLAALEARSDGNG